MSGTYFYPLWLLTIDDARNSQLADLFETEIEEFVIQKTKFYDSLGGTQYHSKALYDLLTIQQLATNMLVRLFRSNLNVLNSTLPTIDVVRIKEKTKNVLGAWKTSCLNITHPFDNSQFIDTILKHEKWDGHPKLTLETGEPVDWNGIILSRLSDIHRNLHELFVYGESQILLHIHGQQDIAMHVTTSILVAVQDIHGQLISYLRFINSL